MIVVLPLWYQPNEPVENSRLSAISSAVPMVSFTASAFSRNCVLEIGQGDLAIPDATTLPLSARVRTTPDPIRGGAGQQGEEAGRGLGGTLGNGEGDHECRQPRNKRPVSGQPSARCGRS